MNNEIKSQDDLNRQGRESDVLIATIMKCQELVRKNVELENENKRLKEMVSEEKIRKMYPPINGGLVNAAEQNKKLKELLKECKKRMSDCLYKLYDEGGQSYLSLEKQLKSSLTKIEEALK